MLEPRRLSDAASDAPNALRDALQDARALNVDHARVARLADRLGVHVALDTAVVSTLSQAPVTSAVAYKLWAYLSGAVAVGGVALVMWSQALAHDRLAASEPAPREVRAQLQTSLPGATEAVTATKALAVPVVSEALVAPSVVPPLRTPPRRRVVESAAVTTSATPQALDPQAELRLLSQAQDALGQAPARALAMTSEHARQFPSGVFAQEREVIAIEALLKLRRTDDATRRGSAFLSTFASSTHAPRVLQMLPTP